MEELKSCITVYRGLPYFVGKFYLKMKQLPFSCHPNMTTSGNNDSNIFNSRELTLSCNIFYYWYVAM